MLMQFEGLYFVTLDIDCLHLPARPESQVECDMCNFLLIGLKLRQQLSEKLAQVECFQV